MVQSVVQLWNKNCVHGWDEAHSDRLVWIPHLTLLFLAMLIKDIWIFGLRGNRKDEKRDCQRVTQKETPIFNTILICPFHSSGTTQLLHSANSKLHFLRRSSWILKTHYKTTLPACQHHKGETLSINSTHFIEAFLSLFFFLAICVTVFLSSTPLLLLLLVTYSICSIPVNLKLKTRLHQRPASIRHLKVTHGLRRKNWDKCVWAVSCKCVLERDTETVTKAETVVGGGG